MSHVRQTSRICIKLRRMHIKFCDESIDVKLYPRYIKLGVLFSNPKCSICHDYRIKNVRNILQQQKNG